MKISESKAFTIIELMVSIFVTLAAIGTFYKLYTSSIKAHRNTNVRTSVNIRGEQLIETIASSIRLIGLNNNYVDYDPGMAMSGTIITDANGSTGTDDARFEFLSPFGGPVTKILGDPFATNPAGNVPVCTFYVLNSASFHAGLTVMNMVTKSGVYSATVSVDGNKVVTSAFNPVPPEPLCIDALPVGTLVTGENNIFRLTYSNTGTQSNMRLVRDIGGGAEEIYIDFSSVTNPAYQIPYFVLQFMREYDDVGTTKREWFTDIDEVTTPEELKEVKSVRVGFVLLSAQDRVRKKVASADAGITTEYCPFEGMCYSLTDQNQTAYTFRRVIHLRNYDYLGENKDISY